VGYGRTDGWVAGHCRRMYLLFNSAVIGVIFGWLLGEHVVAIEKSRTGEAAPVPREHGVRLDDVNGRAPATQECESHVHSMRSTGVNRRRGRRDRFTTASWCRSARISRCNESRDRTINRSEWSSEKTDATNRGYRRTHVTSIDATRTVFSIATGRAVAPRAVQEGQGQAVPQRRASPPHRNHHQRYV
jgi:hypothetical protein